MKDRTILVSALVACCIHVLILFSDFGTTPPTLASAISSIEVTLVAPPAAPAPTAAPELEPEQVKAPQPPEKPEPIPIPEPEPEPVVEPEAEPIETLEPTPLVEPESLPAPESFEYAEPPRRVVPMRSEEVPLTSVTSEDDRAGAQSIDSAADALESGGRSDSLVPAFDSPPGYMYNPKPRYPRDARRRGEEGKVMLLVDVLPNGRVGEISVESSSGHRLLDAAAVKAVRRWRFAPAKKTGRPVRAQVRIPVEFNLRDNR